MDFEILLLGFYSCSRILQSARIYHEVQEVVAEIRKHASTVQVILLGGIQLYPTPIQDLRLKSLSTLRNKFKDAYLEFGLADHIDGENPFAKFLPALALCFGATVLEKHITTNREEKLEDYEAALLDYEAALKFDMANANIRQAIRRARELVTQNNRMKAVDSKRREKDDGERSVPRPCMRQFEIRGKAGACF